MASNGSSEISDTRQQMIILRDNDSCVLCGAYPIDVAPIVARKAGDIEQVRHQFCPEGYQILNLLDTLDPGDCTITKEFSGR
jgi:hypothetical protein